MANNGTIVAGNATMKKALSILLLSFYHFSFSQCPWNFTVNSQPGFTINCSITSITISAVNNNSNSVNYNWSTPAGNFTAPTTQLLSGGACTLVLTDVTTSCAVTQTFFVYTDVAYPNPNVSISPPTQTLTCINPSLLATGSSTTPNTVIAWTGPGTITPVQTSTFILGPPNGPATSTASFFYANYTALFTNTVNGCTTGTLISIYQDFRRRDYPPIVCDSTPAIICNHSLPLCINFTPYVTGGFPLWYYTWRGPAPQNSITSTDLFCFPYNANIAGIYSLSIVDAYNGCSSNFTMQVLDSRPQFYLTGSPPTNSLSCDGSIFINPIPPYGATVSTSSGSLNGTTISNLCNGWVKVCLTSPSSGCRKCDSLMMDAFVGIMPTTNENDFEIFPNPATQSIFIKTISESATLNIYNSGGRKVKTIQVQPKQEIAMDDLNSGIYLLEMRSENSIGRKKLVIIR